jgi:acetyl esterase/lipase
MENFMQHLKELLKKKPYKPIQQVHLRFFRIDTYDNVIYLEIPITIYTPVDANKDKLVIFFHGGGMIINQSV